MAGKAHKGGLRWAKSLVLRLAWLSPYELREVDCDVGGRYNKHIDVYSVAHANCDIMRKMISVAMFALLSTCRIVIFEGDNKHFDICSVRGYKQVGNLSVSARISQRASLGFY